MKLQLGQALCCSLLSIALQTTLAQRKSGNTTRPHFRAGHEPSAFLANDLSTLIQVDPVDDLEEAVPDADREVAEDILGDTAIDSKKVRRHFEKLPFKAEILLATAWVLLIASCPLILTVGNWHKITKTHMVEFVVLLLWLLGGIYLWTNVIYFRSIHFEGEQHLSIVQAVYMLSQVITTVGYGDINASRPRGRLAVAVYIMLSLVVVANIVGEVTGIITDKLANIDREVVDLAETTDMKKKRKMSEAHDKGLPTIDDWHEMTGVWKLNHMGLIRNLCCYIGIAIIGAAFYHLHPSEAKPISDALYMSIVTLSTCGFGAFVAESPIGQAFGAFWMLFGVGALGAFVGGCMEYSLRMKQAEQINKVSALDEMKARLQDVECDEEDRIDEGAFLKFALVQAGYCTEDQIENMVHIFHRLRPDKDHKVRFAALRLLMLNEQQQKTLHRDSTRPLTPSP